MTTPREAMTPPKERDVVERLIEEAVTSANFTVQMPGSYRPIFKEAADTIVALRRELEDEKRNATRFLFMAGWFVGGTIHAEQIAAENENPYDAAKVAMEIYRKRQDETLEAWTKSLRSQLAEAREALKPFAKLAATFAKTNDPIWRNDTGLHAKQAHEAQETDFTVGDLRRARTLVGPT